MATFDLTITYPDGQGARILDALKTHYGAATNAEAIEAFRKETTVRLRQIVMHVERKAATSVIAEVDAT